MKAIENEIFQLNSEDAFNDLALRIFSIQYQTNKVYRKYCDYLNISHRDVEKLEDIPFLPIQFFKTESLRSGDFIPEITFKSSGTGGNRSSHELKHIGLYQRSFLNAFNNFYGNPEEMAILALLPSYLEQGESSLVYMCDQLIKKSSYAESGFFLYEHEQLISNLEDLTKRNIPTLLIGVAYALLDLSEEERIQDSKFNDLIVMETGGMKGRKKELIRDDLHQLLKRSFGLDQIHSEYGMTELLSQAYSKKDGFFKCPPWMKILIRKQEDPFSYSADGQIGGMNIIDLANLYSCSFIQTDDLGKISSKGFEVLGRFDGAEVRGCNLLIAG